MDLISIIIPIFNIESYLEDCLKSVVDQTYKNIEIILIDDGSTDSSGQIADQYANRDKRVVIAHKKNAGLPKARETGVKLAHGKYLTFIDGDDYVGANYIETLHQLINAHNADISCVAYSDKKLSATLPASHDVILNANQATQDFFTEQRFTYGMIWGKLFKKKQFTNVVFPTRNIYEDMFIQIQIFPKIKKYTYSPSKLYFYRQRDNSLKKVYSLDHISLALKFAKIIKTTYTDAMVSSLAPNFQTRWYLDISGVLFLPYLDRRKQKELYQKINSEIKQYQKNQKLTLSKSEQTKLRQFNLGYTPNYLLRKLKHRR